MNERLHKYKTGSFWTFVSKRELPWNYQSRTWLVGAICVQRCSEPLVYEPRACRAPYTSLFLVQQTRRTRAWAIERQLNSDKTEVLWCTTNRRLHQLPVSAMLIDGVPNFRSPRRCMSAGTHVRDLGIYLDRDLLMRIDALCQDALPLCVSYARFVNLFQLHIPDAGGRTHPLQTGLWQQRARWSPSLRHT